MTATRKGCDAAGFDGVRAWEFVDTSEEAERRSLAVFSKWQPDGAEFQGFYGFADNGDKVTSRTPATELGDP